MNNPINASFQMAMLAKINGKPSILAAASVDKRFDRDDSIIKIASEISVSIEGLTLEVLKTYVAARSQNQLLGLKDVSSVAAILELYQQLSEGKANFKSISRTVEDDGTDVVIIRYIKPKES